MPEFLGNKVAFYFSVLIMKNAILLKFQMIGNVFQQKEKGLSLEIKNKSCRSSKHSASAGKPSSPNWKARLKKLCRNTSQNNLSGYLKI